MKYLIMGRTASGKDALADLLCDHYGFSRVVSCTDRPRRDGEGDTHRFMDADAVSAVLAARPDPDDPDAVVASTTVGRHRYFATRSQVEDASLYVIDPPGVERLARAMPQTLFQVVYLTVPKAVEPRRRDLFIKREGGDHAGTVYDERCRAEEPRFTRIDAFLKARADGRYVDPVFPANVDVIRSIENTYDHEVMESIAHDLAVAVNTHDRMESLVRYALSVGILSTDKATGLVHVTRVDPQGRPYRMDASVDMTAAWLLREGNPEGSRFFEALLSMPSPLDAGFVPAFSTDLVPDGMWVRDDPMARMWGSDPKSL